jgi:N-acetylglutamate synthase-like GNAT family acetyltransferase
MVIGSHPGSENLDIRFRDAVEHDFPQMLSLQTVCIEKISVYTPDEIYSWKQYLEREGIKRFAPFQSVLCLSGDNKVIGFASWSTDGKDSANIECLYVLPGQTNHGVGTKLLLELERELSVAGYKTVRVRSTLNARPFYEKNGYLFREVGTSRVGFRIAILQKTLQAFPLL